MDYLKGVRGAAPIVLGYIPIGFAFGVLAIQQGLSITEIFFMSLLVYAGSAQFIGTALIASGAAFSSIIFTTFLVNLRHLLMSASLSPYLKHLTTPILSLISFGITDETYAVSISEVKGQNTSAGYFAGLHITSQCGWILSTVLGGVLGNFIPDPMRWGIDFALSAMFIGLLFMQIKHRKDIIVALCAGSISLFLSINLSDSWSVIIAALLAAAMGVGIELWSQKSSLLSSE